MLRALILVFGVAAIALAAGLASCTTDLLYDFTDSEKKLIINSTFNNGERFRVSLSTSRNILEPNSKNESVLGATVSIRDEDGKLLETLRDGNGRGVYRSSSELTAFAGNTYNLEVTHPDWPGETYTATSSVPLLSESTSIDTSLVFQDLNPVLQIRILLDDLADSDDHYVFEVLIDDSILAPMMKLSEEVVVYGDQEQPRRLFLLDDSFNGKERELEFSISRELPRDSTALIRETEIKVRNVSYELYEYLKSLEEYVVAQNSIGTVNVAAVKVYSNIKKSGKNSGFGIFAGYNQKNLILR